MSTQLARLAILSTLLLAAANSSATMAYNYSSYDNLTDNLDSNGNLLSVTVTLTLEGYTSWNNNPPAKHTGSVILIFGGVYNTNTTGEVNPNTEMDLQATVTLDATDTCFDDGGCEVTEENADVTCTVAGFVFGGSGSMSGWTIKHAKTRISFSGYTCSQNYSLCAFARAAGMARMGARCPRSVTAAR